MDENEQGIMMIVEAIQKADVIAILDKIRAEIAEIPKKYPMTMDYENGLKEALGIIDKYKTEAEEAKAHPINENIAKGFEKFTKMMFRQGQAESEE